MHFASFLGRLSELLGVRMSPTNEQKSMHKFASTKEAPKSAKRGAGHGPEWPAGSEGVTTSPQAQLQSEALDVQLKRPSSKQLTAKL